MLCQVCTLSTIALEEKQALASHTVASADAILQECEIASQSPTSASSWKLPSTVEPV